MISILLFGIATLFRLLCLIIKYALKLIYRAIIFPFRLISEDLKRAQGSGYAKKQRSETTKSADRTSRAASDLWIVTVRIIVLAAVVVGYSLTMPWRIIVPLGIGSITILIDAIASIKRPSVGKEKISNARKEKATGKKDNKKTV